MCVCARACARACVCVCVCVAWCASCFQHTDPHGGGSETPEAAGAGEPFLTPYPSQLPHPPTHSLSYSPTHSPTHSLTLLLTHLLPRCCVTCIAPAISARACSWPSCNPRRVFLFETRVGEELILMWHSVSPPTSPPTNTSVLHSQASHHWHTGASLTTSSPACLKEGKDKEKKRKERATSSPACMPACMCAGCS